MGCTLVCGESAHSVQSVVEKRRIEVSLAHAEGSLDNAALEGIHWCMHSFQAAELANMATQHALNEASCLALRGDRHSACERPLVACQETSLRRWGKPSSSATKPDRHRAWYLCRCIVPSQQ